MGEFPKFPKAVHFGQALNDDEVLVPETSYAITEKLDGANAGVIRADKGLIIHSRNTQLAFLSYYDGIPDEVHNEFRGLVPYIKERMMQKPFIGMQNGDHIFGEWLIKHTLPYPPEMYGHFYAFDHFWFSDGASIRFVPYLGDTEFLPTLEWAEAFLEAAAADVDRKVEGLVLSPQGHPEFPYQPRFKLVRPEFREEAGKKWGVKKQLQASPVEDRLILAYPVRAYQKVMQRIRNLEQGTLEKSHTPKVLGLTWHDYMTEFFPRALKKEKYPTVDTMALKKTFEAQIREMFFTELETGHLPMWAENRNQVAA